jgi:hypothetical protein
MSLLEAGAKLAYQRFCKPFLKRLEDPASAQEECLRKVLNRCKDTLFGKQHRFSDIKSIEAFQQTVPLSNFDRLQPYFLRCMRGEQNVLFPERILLFAVTAGTSGTAKYIPLGERRVEEVFLEGIIGSLFFLVHTGHYDIMDGAGLVLRPGSRLKQKIGEFEVAHFSGAISSFPLPGRLQTLQSFQIDAGDRVIPPQEVVELDDWDQKMYLTARYAVAADIRMVGGVTSKSVGLLITTRNEYLSRLLADPELDEKTKAKLRKVSVDGVIDLQELWPNIRAVITGGISITPYRRIIQDLLGDVTIWESYAANEATMGFQIFPDKGLIPVVTHTFFEFIPENEMDAEPILLCDVKRDTPYRVFVTNTGGFYRYDLGDIVTFSELNPPVFGEISRRSALVDIAQERLSEALFLRVLDRACAQFGTSFMDFAILPEMTSKDVRHILFIEFTNPPDDLEDFTDVVDRRLQAASLTYYTKRKQRALSRPVIIMVQSGGFDSMIRKMGRDPVQGKVTRLLTPELSRLIPRLKPQP